LLGFASPQCRSFTPAGISAESKAGTAFATGLTKAGKAQALEATANMTTSPNRRWFRYSLRTLFIVVTIFGIWFGWNLKTVRERKAVLVALRAACGSSLDFKCDSLESIERDYPTSDLRRYSYARASAVRRILGDESFCHVELPQSLFLNRRLVERVENAFPEARLKMVVRGIEFNAVVMTRDSLYRPADQRVKNSGDLFKTGLFEY
jgi:hypothetical protein